MTQDDAEVPIPTPQDAGTSVSRKVPPPVLTSEEILRGGREIQIRHGDETYWLRLTRNGKLILTK